MRKKVNCLNGRLVLGDTVISLPTVDYGGLIGTVMDIKPIGAPDRETCNDTDDVYVDFRNHYSEQRRSEILENLRDLFQNPQKEWDTCALDSVIMDPKALLKLYPQIHTEEVRSKMLESTDYLYRWCISTMAGIISESVSQPLRRGSK